MCIKVLATDGTAALHAQHAVAYRELLEALGIGSRTALAASAERLYDFLPQLRRESQAVLEAKPNSRVWEHHEFSQEPFGISGEQCSADGSVNRTPTANSPMFATTCEPRRG